MVYSVAAFAPLGASNELYFFQGTRFVHLKDQRKIGEVKSIHDSWPKLRQENMTAIDAVLSSSDGSWFFSGDRCVQVDIASRLADNQVLNKNESIAKQWPALADAGFNTVDAVLRDPHKSHLAYFFSEERYVVVSANPAAEEMIIEGPLKIVDNWPALRQAGFNAVDTVFSDPKGGYFFFCGDQCARVTGVAEKSVLDTAYGPAQITKKWPVLKLARFY